MIIFSSFDPLSIGMIIDYFIPQIKSFIQRIVQPVLILLLLFWF